MNQCDVEVVKNTYVDDSKYTNDKMITKYKRFQIHFDEEFI